MSVENHNICKYCDNAKFDKPCPTCTDLAWEGFSIKEHDKQIRADAIDEFAELLCKYVYGKDFMSDDVIREIAEQLKEQNNE